jgi:hypothetical protein
MNEGVESTYLEISTYDEEINFCYSPASGCAFFFQRIVNGVQGTMTLAKVSMVLLPKVLRFKGYSRSPQQQFSEDVSRAWIVRRRVK